MNTLNMTSVAASRIGTYELQVAIRKNTYRSFMYAMSMLFIFGVIATLLMNRNDTAIAHVFTVPPIVGIPIPPQINYPLQKVKAEVQHQDKSVSQGVPTVVPDVIGKVTPAEALKDIVGSTISGTETNVGIATNKNVNIDTKDNNIHNIAQQSIEYGNDPDNFPEVEPEVDVRSLQQAVSYPIMLRQINKEGMVLLAVKIGVDGTPLDIVVEQSDHPMFTESAIKAVKTQKFKPARQNNQAVVCWMRIPVSFKIK